MIVDTDILIDHFHGNADATAFVREALLHGEPLLISIATVSELLAGMRPGEEEDTNALLSLFRIYPADEPIARIAGAFLNQYGRQHRLDLGDEMCIRDSATIFAWLRSKLSGSATSGGK